MSNVKPKNKPTSIIFALAIAAAVFFGIGWVVNNDGSVSNNQPSVAEETAKTTNEISFSADQRTVAYGGETGKTAIEILRDLTEINGVDNPEFGFFLTGINGLEANDDIGEFWAFYVNGQAAQVGASNYQTTDGEEIQWKLEVYQAE